MARLDEPLRPRRSLLFVPGADGRKLERARVAGADVLLLDLEDAVALERKPAARKLVAEALRAGAFGDVETAVRVNAPSTPEFEADLEAVIGAGVRNVMIPKAANADELARVAGAVEALERRLGIPQENAVGLLLLVESPAGIANASAIGGASPRITALCFGHADFSMEMGLAAADASQAIVHHARCTLAISARACGVAPIDTVYLAFRDDAGFREDAALGLSLGFEGKLCIHPRQVAIANQVYTPSPREVEQAKRILEAWGNARLQGVFELDGRMIDAPVVALQRRVIERARRAGALA